MQTETWYEVESSAVGADDWYATRITGDSAENLRRHLEGGSDRVDGFEFRIVRKTLTTEATE